MLIVNLEKSQLDLFEPDETIRKISAIHKTIIELLRKESCYDIEIDFSIRNQLDRFVPKPEIVVETFEQWLTRTLGPFSRPV